MKRVERVFSILEDVLSSIFLYTGLFIILYGVFMRYFLNLPQSWVDDTSRYLVIWGIFIGVSIALRNDEHIKIDILYEFLNEKLKRLINFVSNLIGLSLFVLITYYSFELIISAYESGQILIGLELPIWIVYLILPIMGIMVSIRYGFILCGIKGGKN